MPTADYLLLTNASDPLPAPPQRSHACAACRSQPHDTFTIPAEVFRPDLGSWVEKRDLLARLWIERRLVSPLTQRTRDTRQRQVIGRGRPTSRARKNVVQMERRFLPELGKPTV